MDRESICGLVRLLQKAFNDSLELIMQQNEEIERLKQVVGNRRIPYAIGCPECGPVEVMLESENQRHGECPKCQNTLYFG